MQKKIHATPLLTKIEVNNFDTIENSHHVRTRTFLASVATGEDKQAQKSRVWVLRSSDLMELERHPNT